mmetsp:Transcript_23483/g.40521  ORF Transcript_23483/g.40521 Transcript_23483/m.40521 type:complete len:160 (-) Transcript_23483:2210-2689(-)
MMDATQLLTYWLVYGLTYAISDAFEFLLCWLPLWPYLKLAFFLWLWYPATDGAGLLYSNHLCKILEAIAPQIEVYVGQLWALLDQVAARKEEAEAKPAAAEKGACEAKAAPAEVEDTNSNSVSEAAAAEKAKEQSKETEQVAEPEEPKVEDDEKEATPE